MLSTAEYELLRTFGEVNGISVFVKRLRVGVCSLTGDLLQLWEGIDVLIARLQPITEP